MKIEPGWWRRREVQLENHRLFLRTIQTLIAGLSLIIESIFVHDQLAVFRVDLGVGLLGTATLILCAFMPKSRQPVS